MWLLNKFPSGIVTKMCREEVKKVKIPEKCSIEMLIDRNIDFLFQLIYNSKFENPLKSLVWKVLKCTNSTVLNWSPNKHSIMSFSETNTRWKSWVEIKTKNKWNNENYLWKGQHINPSTRPLHEPLSTQSCGQ